MHVGTRHRPSATARAVAVGRAVGLHGISDPVAASLLSPLGRGLVAGAHRLMQVPGGSRAVAAAMGGLNVHAGLRMAAIDAETTSAVTGGIGQIVVVGAGFDSRAWRLASLAGCRLIEVDLPATQRVKRELVEGVDPVADVTFAAADLSVDALAEVLRDSPFDPAAPTLWIWEAVTPYLADSAVRATTRALADLSAPGSRLAMTFAHGVGPGGPVRQAVEAVARRAFVAIGEPLRSAYDDWDIADLVTEAGFIQPVITGSREWALAEGLQIRSLPWAAERLIVASSPDR